MSAPKCPECTEPTTVYVGPASRTLMGGILMYYSDTGVYHHHDPNKTTKQFSCANGHRWAEVLPLKCPGCDWPNGEQR